MVNQISDDQPSHNTVPWLSLAFRPFFIGAGLFSVIAITLWMLIYSFGMQIGIQHIPLTYWHAHEMIFGYGLAVIAGFLLTAVINWTGVKTVTGIPLLLMFLFWGAARLMPFIEDRSALYLMASFDSLFCLFFAWSFARSVFISKQWKQLGILSKILLLLASNIIFYLGVTGVLADGMRWGIYLGLYLIIALILMMGRRVIPFFIEMATGQEEVKNSKLLDISSLILFLFFMFSDILAPSALVTALLALALTILHSLRLYMWYTISIWTKPLLWVLFVAYMFITAGFALKTAGYFVDIPGFISLHAFAFGGIGIMTIGMMARVSLGHTGRDISNPPKGLSLVFLLITAGAIVRVFFPMITATQYYMTWIVLAQFLWIASFSIFLYLCLPILVRQEVS